jgi:hypothetical protein
MIRPPVAGTQRLPYETIHQPLAPRPRFVRRVLARAGAIALLILGSLAMGVLGYHHFERLPWLDALLNASMIMGGMGPVDPVKSTGGKLFASFYALYCGLLLLVAAGLLLAPALHRLLHRFHLEEGRRRE